MRHARSTPSGSGMELRPAFPLRYVRHDKTWYRGVIAQVRETSGGGVAYRVEWDGEDSHSIVPASRVRPAQD